MIINTNSNHTLTPWSRVLEKLVITKLFNKFFLFLWNWDDYHHHVHNRELLHPILSKIGPVHILTPHFFKNLFKVFDCVNYELLIHKLQFYGVREVFLDWFRSYLFDRKQRVKIKLTNTITDASNWKIIKCGICQSLVQDHCCLT